MEEILVEFDFHGRILFKCSHKDYGKERKYDRICKECMKKVQLKLEELINHSP